MTHDELETLLQEYGSLCIKDALDVVTGKGLDPETGKKIVDVKTKLQAALTGGRREQSMTHDNKLKALRKDLLKWYYRDSDEISDEEIEANLDNILEVRPKPSPAPRSPRTCRRSRGIT